MRWFRFRLRTALVGVTLLCVALGMWVASADRQKAAVDAIRRAGGVAHFTYEFDSNGYFRKDPRPLAPAWLRNVLGENLFVTLDGVYFQRQSIDDHCVADVMRRLRPISSLRWLEFRDTAITDQTLDEVAELTQLRRLFVRSSESDSAHRTQITDAGLAKLCSLSKLNCLSLGKCPIDGTAFKELASLHHLQELDLRDTHFSDASAAYLCPLTSLKQLNLWKTPVTSLAMPELARLQKLEELYFWDNDLSDAAVAELAKLTNLQLLDLSGTKVTDGGIKSLSTLSRLRELRLAKTRVIDPPIDRFTELRTLKVSNATIGDPFLDRASQLLKLEDLDCFECRNITDAGIERLDHAPALKRLYFPPRVGISPETLNRLRQAKPALTIEF